MKNKKKSDNSNAVIIGVFVFVMLMLVFFSYFRPDKMMGKKNYTSSTEVFKKPADKSKRRNQEQKPALKSEQPNSKKQSATNVSAGTNEKPPMKTSLIGPGKGVSDKTPEEDADTRKNIFLYYHKPFLENLGISSYAVNKVMELYSGYDAKKEIMHHSYDSVLPDDVSFNKLNSEVKLSRAAYDNKIKGILGKKNFDQYDLFDQSLPNRELVNYFNETLGRDEKINEKTKESLILSLYNRDNQLLTKNRDLINSVSEDPSAYNRIRAAQKIEYLDEAKKILSILQYSRFVEFLENN